MNYKDQFFIVEKRTSDKERQNQGKKIWYEIIWKNLKQMNQKNTDAGSISQSK